jgi:uncharacterized protein (TIGR02147 family)
MMTRENDLNINPRQLLIEELERRCRENPRYSLRAFAKALDISPSALSMILAGQRGLSKGLASQVSNKLGLDPNETQNFILNSLRRGKPNKQNEAQNFSQLSLDKFATISEWYHFAILSLVETKGFTAKVSWIASRLGISIAEAKAAVERLSRLGILDTAQPKWKLAGPPPFVGNEESTAATKRFQKQVLEKAMYSLENDPMELRDLNSFTIAINPKHVGFARKEMEKFLIDLMHKLEKKGDALEVYHLSAQICPVSKNRGN